MSIYKHILMATDSITNSDDTLDVTKEMSEVSGTTVSLLYTVPPLNTSGLEYQLPSIVDIENRMICIAKERLMAAANAHDIYSDDETVAVGVSSKLILEQANKKKVDLIIVNNDNQQAASLIGKAQCDILAVHNA
jgi:nucleotide-binding universal stress UspA family protein